MLQKVVLIFIIVFAIAAIQTEKLRRAIVYLGVFSLLSSFCFLLYSAPDVALAEAVIGSTLATVIYLVSFQKYRVFTIYYTNEDANRVADKHIIQGRNNIMNIIEQYCIQKELEPQMVYTVSNVSDIVENMSYDLIIRQKGKNIMVFGRRRNYQVSAICKYLEGQRKTFESNGLNLEMTMR